MTVVSFEIRAAELDELALVARWHWDEWGHADPSGSVTAWEAGLRERVVFVAVCGGRSVGSAVLMEHDMSTHPELRSWFGGLFVLPGFRGRGIARALCVRCIGEARRRGERELFLHTATATGLYESLGWKTINTEAYEGEMTDVMRLDLC